VRNAAASSGVKRRSAARISTSSPRAQAGEGQRRVGAAGDHQVQGRGEVVEQEGQPFVDLSRVDGVVVVQHQHDIAREGTEFVEQRGEDRVDRRRLRRLEERERPRVDPGHGSPQRGDQVGPEGCRLIVALVEREPGHRLSIGRRICQPLGQQRRLAAARRRGDERQRPCGPVIQAFAQA
jgi:hypothetical protein